MKFEDLAKYHGHIVVCYTYSHVLSKTYWYERPKLRSKDDDIYNLLPFLLSLLLLLLLPIVSCLVLRLLIIIKSLTILCIISRCRVIVKDHKFEDLHNHWQRGSVVGLWLSAVGQYLAIVTRWYLLSNQTIAFKN